VSKSLAILVLAFLVTRPAEAFDTEAAQTDLSDVRAQIVKLDQAIDEGMPDAARVLAEVRRQTLGVTADLLEQRIVAEQTGAEIKVTALATTPDLERAQELLAEIAAAEEELAHLRQEAADKLGLPGALAQLTVLTQEQALAVLRLGYYQAHYGLAPLSVPSGGGAAGEVAASRGELEAPEISSSVAPPAWADPRYPDIDYTTSWFDFAALSDSEARGMWVITSERAALDDSLTVIAMAPDDPSPGILETPKKLVAMCKEGQTVFVFSPDEYLLSYRDSGFDVEYRVGQQPPETGLWGASTSKQHVGFWGENAIEFLQRLRGQERFFVRVQERDGSQHGAEFDIRGIDDVIAAIETACGWAGRTLSRDQLMTIQNALKQAGHYGGAIDGIWGANSRSGLAKYQATAGLTETGTLNTETLEALGIAAQE